MNRRKTKKILSLLLAFAMVVTGSNATFRTVAAAETSDTAGKDLPLSEEDGYTAYMLFTDKDWAWGNWDPQKDGGWENDAIITGDGTYTVSIDREGYEKYLEEHETAGSTGTTPGSIKAANGANCFMVDFKEMATAQNFDISNMKVKDVTIKCDGKVFPSDTSKMYFGDIESKNNLRLEIRNEYGYSGAFKTREEFDEMNPDFTFSDSLSVTFTLEGIQKGTTGRDLCYTDDDLPIVRTLDGWNRGETVTPLKTSGTVTPTKTPRPTYTKVPEEQAKDLPLSEENGYTAHLMFVDNDWTWGNWDAQKDGGWGHDAVITGDGTYTVSIDKVGYMKYLEENVTAGSTGTTSGSIKAANGVNCFMVDFNEMATAQNFDISNMKVEDVTIKCDGKVFPSDASKMFFGDIENRGNLRLEIQNEYGYNRGDFETKYVFDPNGEFAFSDSLSVTFTLEGIQKGNTLNDVCYFEDETSVVWSLDQWNQDSTVKPTAGPEQTTKPEITARPIYTKIPEEQAKNLPLSEEDGYKAFLMFTDQNWEWGNWNANDDGGWGKDAVITGDGTYTVSIDREGYEKYLESQETAGSTGTTPGSIKAANGANCFMVDFKEMATAQNFDISNMKVKDVTIKCDGKVFPSDTSKMYFGDIESKNNLRLEIRNEYGYDGGDFETRYAFDPNGEFTFSDSLSVTFTLEGIQKGNSLEGLFYDSDGKRIVRTLEQWNLDGGNFVPTAKPGEEHTGGPYKAAIGFQVSSTYDFRDGYEYQEASEKYNVWLREQGKEVPDYNDLNIYLNGNGSELYQKGDLKGTLKKPEKVELYREAVITDAVMEKDGDYTVSIKNLELDKASELESYFNMLGVYTNIPFDQYKNDILVKATVRMQGKEIAKDVILPLKGGRKNNSYMKYCQFMLADIYATHLDTSPNPMYHAKNYFDATDWATAVPVPPVESEEPEEKWEVLSVPTGSFDIEITYHIEGVKWTADEVPTASPDAPLETMAPEATKHPSISSPLVTSIPTKRPLVTLAPTGQPGSSTNPVKTPNPTKKPGSTKRPSKTPEPTMPPAPTLEPTETPEATPEASVEPTLQPGDEPTAEPGNGPTETPTNTSAASKDPENQTISQPTATPVLKTTPAPTAKAYGEAADEGEELEDNSGVTYTVTQTGKKAEVEYSAPKENAKGTVKIPDKVTINGVSYKVTSVADNAFKNNDKIKKVVINKNITSIGKNAFSGCKNLKTITITSTKLTSKSISKNAFKGISGKVVIKVPKGMKKKYKKLFRAKGLSKKVRIV